MKITNFFIRCIFFIGLVLLFFQCNETIDSENSGENIIEQEIFKSSVNNLRVRKEPSTKARIEYELEENQEVIYTGEKSTEKEEIRIGGEKISDYWYKVKVKKDEKVIGWVFGGGLRKNEIEATSSSDNIAKNVKKLSAKELQKLINIKGIRKENEPYKGKYEYYTTKNGKEVLNGLFSFTGIPSAKEYEEEYSEVKYTGEFINGDKTGDFKEVLSFYEGDQELTISFVENQCKKTILKGDSEGMDYAYNYENKYCNFIIEEYGNYTVISENNNSRQEAPSIQFTKGKSHDFGTIREGEIYEHDFKYTNNGNSPLKIIDAISTTSSTIPIYSKAAIQPGDSGVITFRFLSKGKKGKRYQKIKLITNAVPQEHEILLQGEVIPITVNNSSGYSSPRTYQEKVTSVGEVERANPVKFLDATGTYRPNFLEDKLKVNGTVTNKATVTSYKDATVRVTFYSKSGTNLGSEDYVIYEIFPPRKTVKFKLKVTNYKNVAKIGWDVIKAKAYQ